MTALLTWSAPSPANNTPANNTRHAVRAGNFLHTPRFCTLMGHACIVVLAVILQPTVFFCAGGGVQCLLWAWIQILQRDWRNSGRYFNRRQNTARYLHASHESRAAGLCLFPPIFPPKPHVDTTHVTKTQNMRQQKSTVVVWLENIDDSMLFVTPSQLLGVVLCTHTYIYI